MGLPALRAEFVRCKQWAAVASETLSFATAPDAHYFFSAFSTPCSSKSFASFAQDSL